MNTSPTREAHSTALDDLAALATSWRRSHTARRVSSAIIHRYGTAVAQLAAFLHDHGMPDKVGAIRREHVEAFVLDLLQRRA